ncbi:MAG: hypothetical protein QHI48_01730 [Bacteroidota bacterium]|nr:hypothetical protein [Bacteroidota bacterium]
MDVAGIQKCEITYRSACADGSTRRVDLSLLDFCGGSDARSRTYTAPFYHETPTFIHVAPRGGSVREEESFIVPVELESPVPRSVITPSRISVRYDTSMFIFEGLGPLEGCLLHDARLTASTAADVVLVTTNRNVVVEGAGTLFRLRFRAKTVDKPACGFISVDAWNFNAGCVSAITKYDTVCISALTPDLRCMIDKPPDPCWDRARGSYTPDTIRLEAAFFNAGAKRAKNLRFRLSYDAADVELIEPLSSIQAYPEPDLAPGDSIRVAWLLRALPRSSPATFTLCIEAQCENQLPVSCCVSLNVSEADPWLACSVGVPPLSADSLNMCYLPTPLPCTVTVRNTGGKRADSVMVRFALPPGVMMYAGGKDTHPLNPFSLEPGESGTCFVPLRVLPRTMGGVERISIHVESPTAPPSECSVPLVVPPLHAPVVVAECSVPDVLHADTLTGTYAQNPFPVEIRVRNVGDRPAENAAATITLPDGVVLQPGEQRVKSFTPSTLSPQGEGGKETVLSWRVLYTRRSTAPVKLPFRWLISTTGSNTTRKDSIYVVCMTDVEAFPPDFTCTLEAPSEIRVDTVTGSLSPDPLTVRYTLRHMGKRPVHLRFIEASAKGDGLRFSPATPPVRLVDRVFSAGDSLVVTWSLLIERRSSPREITVFVSAVDDDENRTTCLAGVNVEAVQSDLACTLAADVDSVMYDIETGHCSPGAWILSGTVSNISSRVIADVEVRPRATTSASGSTVVFTEGSDTSAVRKIPLFFPGQSKEFVWEIRYRGAPSCCTPDTVSFSLELSGAGAGTQRSACVTRVLVVPVQTARPLLLCSLAATDTVSFFDTSFVPPFVGLDVRIENRGTATAHNIRAFLLQNTGFTVLGDAVHSIDRLGPGEVVNLTGPEGFILRPHPTGWARCDTLVVRIVAEDADAVSCEKRTIVQRAGEPLLHMSCMLSPDTVRIGPGGFAEPSRVRMEVLVRNDGDAPAHECTVFCAGSARFVPADSVVGITLGDLEPGASARASWDLVPLPAGGEFTDTLTATAIASGGIGNRLQSARCQAVIHAVGSAKGPISLSCSVPDTIGLDQEGSSPLFRFTATISNTGAVETRPGEITIHLPAEILLSSGDAVIAYPSLSPGASMDFSWVLRADRVAAGRKRICCACVSAEGEIAACCAESEAVREGNIAMSVACSGPDTIRYGRNEAWDFCLTIANNAPTILKGVHGVVKFEPAGIFLPVAEDSLYIARIEPGTTSGPVCIRAFMSMPVYTGRVSARWSVRSPTGDTVECVSSTVLLPPLSTRLGIEARTEPSDTLHFDRTRRVFEGEEIAAGITVFRLHADVRNLGDSTARDVRVQVLPPEGVFFDDGETAEKGLDGIDVLKGSFGTVSWRFRAARRREGALRRFIVRAWAANAAEVEGTANLFIQGAPRVAQVRLPQNVIIPAGMHTPVPIELDAREWGDVRSYSFLLAFDERLLTLAGVRPTERTAFGWVGPKVEKIFSTPTGDAIWSVRDTSVYLPFRREPPGAVVNVVFDAVFGFGEENMAIEGTPLRFVRSVPFLDGWQYTSSLDGVSAAETPDAEAVIEFSDGFATISGDCLHPVEWTAVPVLGRNRPNPFNPSTRIPFTLEHDAAIAVTVRDMLGRTVWSMPRTVYMAGSHEIIFDGSGLPAGHYRCTLETASATVGVTMTLLK